jgi:hypothetical protein
MEPMVGSLGGDATCGLLDREPVAGVREAHFAWTLADIEVSNGALTTRRSGSSGHRSNANSIENSVR